MKWRNVFLSLSAQPWQYRDRRKPLNSRALYSLGPTVKWNESGFRPLLCTYRLNWARRASWGWWDEWDDTALQTQDSKFEPWRSEAEHVTFLSRRLPTIVTFRSVWGRNIFFFQTVKTGKRTPNSSMRGSGANHYHRAPAPYSAIRSTAHYMPSNSLEHFIWRSTSQMGCPGGLDLA